MRRLISAIAAALVTMAALMAFPLSASAQSQTQRPPLAVFYMMETPKSVASFEAHIDKIGVLVPTWYGVDKNGLVSGAARPRTMRLANEARLPVKPIISLTDRAGLHALLTNPAAQDLMVASMVREVRANGYAGFHFDFENVDWRDRDAFTGMTKRAADAMHRIGKTLDVAVVPNAPGHPGAGPFSKWMWEFWRGAYDIEALGKAADSITLMTYDQHTRWTTPGPVGGMPWVMEHVNYALKLVPADKISLGIPLYGYRWHAGDPVRPDGTEASNILGSYIDADESFPLIQQYDIQVQWDPVDQEAFFFFYRDQMREWVFMPEARAFKARYDVAVQYGLEGFSAWVLGSEDPAIWDHLPVVVR